MMTCHMCKEETDIASVVKVDDKYVELCPECKKKHHYATIEANLESIEKPNHFRGWDMGHMSDAFWLHLGIYKKNPNRKSLSVMWNALHWAFHADHGLSSSFMHALDWCGIDLWKEKERTDLPEA